MVSSYSQYFNNAFGDQGQTGYIKTHYETSGYFLGGDMLNKNVLSRYRNAFTTALNTHSIFPKAILLIMEQEFLNSLNHYNPGFSILVGRIVESLANQLHRIVTGYKDKLPSKARKFKYPTILWVNLPEHYDWKHLNEFRKKFNSSVKATTSLFREMDILSLDWDDCDRGMFTRDKLNAHGLMSYWSAVNVAFEKWDRNQMKLSRVPSCGTKKGRKPSTYRESVVNTRKFDWNPQNTKFKLPTPPTAGFNK